MGGVLDHDSKLVRLYRAGDNLGKCDEFYYESCPWCSIDCSTCWPAVQRPTTVSRVTDAPHTVAEWWWLIDWLIDNDDDDNYNRVQLIFLLKYYECKICLYLLASSSIVYISTREFNILFIVTQLSLNKYCLTEKHMSPTERGRFVSVGTEQCSITKQLFNGR